VLGVVAGELLGPRAKPLKQAGQVLVTVLKLLATPLIFFAVADALSKTNVRPRSGLKLIALSTTNALVAAAIALGLANTLPLGKSLPIDHPHVELARAPATLVDLLQQRSAPAAIVLAIGLGLALKRARSPMPARLVARGYRATAWLLERVVLVVPLAAFGVIAAAVGERGLAIFATLGAFVLVVATGFLLHSVVYYSALLRFGARRSAPEFFKLAAEPLLTAFSAGSSLATLPVTLRTLDEKMRVSPGNARLAACVGTNLNHDGILLYEATAALFVAQAYGVDLGWSQQVTVAVTSTLAAVGIAGVPDAGLITLSLVLASVGLPMEAAPLLLPVDWLLGRLRATVNVASDLVVANVLERWEPARDEGSPGQA
jgi:Na+/H+-dicarboxylate symporter